MRPISNVPNSVAMQIEQFKPTIRETEVKITQEDTVRFDEYAKRWKMLGACSSSSSIFDMIKSVAVAHAILSGHKQTTFNY